MTDLSAGPLDPRPRGRPRSLDKVADLKVEILRLQACLAAVLNCEDRRCHLCPVCINAVRPPAEVVEPPLIGEDSPIRVFRRPRRKGIYDVARSA